VVVARETQSVVVTAFVPVPDDAEDIRSERRGTSSHATPDEGEETTTREHRTA
jgi:hypothetical protein